MYPSVWGVLNMGLQFHLKLNFKIELKFGIGIKRKNKILHLALCLLIPIKIKLLSFFNGISNFLSNLMLKLSLWNGSACI